MSVCLAFFDDAGLKADNFELALVFLLIFKEILEKLASHNPQLVQFNNKRMTEILLWVYLFSEKRNAVTPSLGPVCFAFANFGCVSVHGMDPHVFVAHLGRLHETSVN